MKKILALSCFLFMTLSLFAIPGARRVIKKAIRNEVKKDVVRKKGDFLGERIVDFRAEKDVILVTRAEGRFRKLVFEVDGNAVEIFRLIVDYAPPGGIDDIPVKMIFREGEWSRIIDLRGGDRAIREITFFYRTVGKPRRGKATIRVYGL